jgi:hypothetical protein
MGRPQNRLELRRQHEAAEDIDPMEDEAEVVVDDDVEEVDRKPKKKAKAPAKSKAKTPKAGKPAARMRIVWTVVSDAFKPVATFDFTQRDAAQAKADELTAKGKGTYFVQRTKEAMPDDAPGLGAAIPRTPPPAAAAAVATRKAAAEVLEDEEDTDDDGDADMEIEEDDDDE